MYLTYVRSLVQSLKQGIMVSPSNVNITPFVIIDNFEAKSDKVQKELERTHCHSGIVNSCLSVNWV